MPSTFTGTSLRAQAMRTTPSSVVVAFAAAAAAIRSASSFLSSWAEANSPAPTRPNARTVPNRNLVLVIHR